MPGSVSAHGRRRRTQRPPDVDPSRALIEERIAAAGLPPLPRLAWLEIDLDAIAANVRAIRSVVGDGVLVEPVVKADAYGHGAVPIALALEQSGADGFCVAALDEGVALRRAGVRAPILTLYPIPPEQVAEAARRRIAVASGGGRAQERLLTAAAALAGRGLPRLHVHLEVETGLGRGGSTVEEVGAAARAIADHPVARLAGLWTHLQAAEDAPTTTRQMERFEAALEALRRAGIQVPRRHVAASGMILSAGLRAHDAVRPGLSIYGIVPDELGAEGLGRAVVAGLRPAMSLYARPVRVIDLPAGWGIGYGPSFVTSRPSRLATLPLGYGDGWARSLTNRATALVRGRRVPLVGNVSMDGIVADVTDVPGSPVTEDDEFVLLGTQGPETTTALDVARMRTTNTWEVVTSMAQRLPRVYHAASDVVGVRTLLSGEPTWRVSNAGTGTSAISRST